MCGIAGIARAEARGVRAETMLRMAAALRHRGPDGYGFFASARAGLAHTRLAIIDRAGGAQPMGAAGTPALIAYNGEAYNYRELRAELAALGRRFRTESDTEVVLQAWAAWGPAMLERLNGQFALAIWDPAREAMFLARDRFGVRPLFYHQRDGDLWFASEVKALLATGEITAEPDPAAFDEVFTFWGPVAPRTPFRGVAQLPPGCWAEWRAGRLAVRRWWEPAFSEADAEPADAVAQLDALLQSAVALRLRADVPVGGYLSGGLDSSIACALAARHSPYRLRTFSVTFDDPALDESAHQHRVAALVGSEHAVRPIAPAAIAEVFPAVVRHAETPMIRTAPAPLFLLARLTRERGITVVLTGEGADEIFLGYDLFKETLVRWFCLRQPGSTVRPRLFGRLYPYLGGARGGELWQRFFLEGADPADPLFSHQPRMRLTGFVKQFYGDAMRDTLQGRDVAAERRAALPPRFAEWSLLARAAWLERETLLASYLLCAQGDRMAMAHGVEGRFPFLDHRLAGFAAALPTRSLLRGLRDKDLLRRWAAAALPPDVTARPKQPYRAPDVPPFFAPGAPSWVRDLLEPRALKAAGLFAPDGVTGLVRRCAAGQAGGVRESQALVGVLSAQLWHHEFVAQRPVVPPLSPDGADVRLGAADLPASAFSGAPE